MGDQNVKIIKCGPIYFFTSPLPAGAISTLSVQKASYGDFGDVSTDVIMCGNRPYFAITIAWFPTRHPISSEDEATAILKTLQYTWNEMYERRYVDSPDMPEWIEGDPTDMLPRGTRDVSVHSDGSIWVDGEAIGQVPASTFS